MDKKDFHITIGSHPSQYFSVEDDMRLVKASLLYADKAKLCSFTTSMLLTVLSYGLLDNKQRIEFVESLLPVVAKNQENGETTLFALKIYDQLKRKKRLNKQELLLKMQYNTQLKKAIKGIEDNLGRMLEDSGIVNLIKAIDSGLLEIEQLNVSENDKRGQKTGEQFVEVLSQAISDENTYPLFDDQTGDLVRLALKEGKMQVSKSGISRGKHTALASNLISRLPLFEKAEIDEILDIRRELERSLIRFRSAIVKFSESIENASWDEDFSYDTETVFMRDIEPAILDIEDAVKNNNYLTNLTRKIADKPLNIPTGTAL